MEQSANETASSDKSETIEEEGMSQTDKKSDKSTWAIGGSLLMGLGVGFFFLKTFPLACIGCMILGLGLGLVIRAVISSIRGKE
jgi:F0F1-type ATP synthase assembly protein I